MFVYKRVYTYMCFLHQLSVLDEASHLLPSATWWIKADGVDVVSKLGESVRLKWSGDVDLNDGKLSEMYTAYQDRLEFIKGIGVNRRQREDMLVDLNRIESDIVDDLGFLHQGAFHHYVYYFTNKCIVFDVHAFPSPALSKAKAEYSSRLDSGKAARQTLFSLGWNFDKLSKLSEEGRKLRVETQVLLNHLQQQDACSVSYNIPRQLTDFRYKMLKFVKEITRRHRTVATHMLVVMISPEDRSCKPYLFQVVL